jgi:hypothetical protein
MTTRRRSNGHRSKTAAALGLRRTRFYTLLRRFGLELSRRRGRAGGQTGYSGFRKRISRTPDFSSSESKISSPAKRKLMSRFCRTHRRGHAEG